jgi:dsDNA-specific endonuclease/ATPase MutS2
MNGPRQELEKQSLVVEELRRQCDGLFSELSAQWKDTTETPAEHKFERERQLKQNYQQMATELHEAIHKANDLLYKCSGGEFC